MKYWFACLLLAGSVFADEDEKKEDVGTVVGIDLGTTYSWYVRELPLFLTVFEGLAT